MSRKTVSRLGFSTLIRRIASVFNVEKSLGRTSSAAVTRRIHAVPWLRTSETPGIERSWASSTASLVSSSTKSDWTRALRAEGDLQLLTHAGRERLHPLLSAVFEAEIVEEVGGPVFPFGKAL